MTSDNPILACVESMAICGWHPTTVSAERGPDGTWRAVIGVADDVPPGPFSWSDYGAADAETPHAITAPPPGPLADVPGVTLHHRVNRPPDYTFVLPPESADVYEQWVAAVARAGRAPDWAWAGSGRISCRPVEWLPEPVRSMLLRQSGAEGGR